MRYRGFWLALLVVALFGASALHLPHQLGGVEHSPARAWHGLEASGDPGAPLLAAAIHGTTCLVEAVRPAWRALTFAPWFLLPALILARAAPFQPRSIAVLAWPAGPRRHTLLCTYLD